MTDSCATLPDAPADPAALDYDVLVVGAGIGGMESALKLGDMGYKVLLVEKEASVGGKMILLSKVFPTLDCASCISTPKMASSIHHPNLPPPTHTRVDQVQTTADRPFPAFKALGGPPQALPGCPLRAHPPLAAGGAPPPLPPPPGPGPGPPPPRPGPFGAHGAWGPVRSPGGPGSPARPCARASSEAVGVLMGVSPEGSRVRVEASSPPIPGISRSRRITSGWTSAATLTVFELAFNVNGSTYSSMGSGVSKVWSMGVSRVCSARGPAWVLDRCGAGRTVRVLVRASRSCGGCRGCLP